MARSQYATPLASPLAAVLGRHGVGDLVQLATGAAVALHGDELDVLADFPTEDPRDRFRELAERDLLGREAALWLTSPTGAFVGDWVRGAVYEIEFDVFANPLTDAEWSAARVALVEEWFALRTGWAAEGHLADPELAAAVRAFARVAREVLRLRPNEFRVGGRRIG